MAHKDEYLQYTVHLNDLGFYNSRFQPSVGAELATVDDKLFRSPQDAANVYGAALALVGTPPAWPGGALPIQFDPRDTFASPCVRSTWFGSTAFTKEEFPLDQLTFTRKSGGWFGIPWLFGDKTTYHWIGRFEYSPKLGAGVPSTVTKLPMPTRRWIDGGEMPAQGEGASGGTTDVSRRASRHAQGFGYTNDSGVQDRTHSHTENGTVAAPGCWERFYIRFLRFPDAPIKIWRQSSSLGAQGALITITSGGTLTLNDFDGISTAVPVGAIETLVIGRWYKVDVIYSYNRAGVPGIPSFCSVYIKGLQKIVAGGVQLPGLVGLTKTCAQSIIGGGKLDGTASNAIWNWDDWIGTDAGNSAGVSADQFEVQAQIGAYNDFIVGSRVALIAANGFASDHGTWIGDWRLSRQRPVTAGVAQQMTSVTSGAILGLTTDAKIEIDGQANQQGLVALNVAIFADRGGAGANGALGWKLPAGANDTAPIVQSAGTYQWNNRLYAPLAIVPLTPVSGLELKFVKGASVDNAKVQALQACAEIIGVFGDEDVYPQSALGTPIAQPVGSVQKHIGIHNAPYPHTPWAIDKSTAPQAPVVVKTGQYVGTGTFLDLKFRAPVHFLWIRPEAGGSGGIQWFSSMLAAHVHGQRSYAPETILEVLIDPTFVEGGAVETDMTLPVAPDNLEEAAATSNQLAYGFAHNGAADAVWQNYLQDPTYYFKRMLGDQAQGGPDQAVAGLYAVPPSPWLSMQQQQTIVRLAGSHLDSNALGVNYDYIAFCDPGMRFSNAGGLSAFAFNGDIVSPLDVETFLPETVLLLQEQDGASSTQTLMMKGLGSAAAAISVLTLPEIASGLSVSNGTMTHKAGLLAAGGNQNSYIAFRRNDNSGDAGAARVLGLFTFVGDGSGARTLNFTPTGRRPMWALVVGHNGTTFLRDPYHLTTASHQFPNTNNPATGIVGGGIDQLMLGVAANTNAITFDVLVFWGSATAGNGGFSPPGEFINVDPASPFDGPWDPPPVPPITTTPTDPNFPAGRPPNDFGTQCVAASTRIINQALSRIGVSKQIANILTDATNEAVTARLHYSDDVERTLRDFPWPFATHYATLVVVAGPSPVASPDWLYAYRRPIDCVFERRLCLARGAAVDPTPPPFQLGNDPDTLSTVVAIPILGNTATAPTRFATGPSHAFVLNQFVTIAGVVGSLPDVNGRWQVSAVIDATHFEIALTCTVPGTGGTATADAVVQAVGGGLIYTNQAAAVLEYTARPECAAGRGDPLFRDALAWRHAASLAPALTRMTDAAVNATKMYYATIDLAHAVLRPGNPGRPATAAATFDLTAAAIAANLNVVNRGLVRIGAQTITNLTTDQGREATAVRLIFEEELQGVLRDFPWSFATAYADPLVLVGGTATVPVNKDWQYSYRVPANLVMARRLVREGLGRQFDPDPPQFRLGSDALGGLLFTNGTPAVLEYTVRLDAAVQRADTLFRDAFAWRLAASLAPSLAMPDPERVEQLGRGAEDPTVVKQRVRHLEQLRLTAARNAWQMYFSAISKARSAEAQEQQQSPEGLPDWLSGRQ